MDKLYLCYNQLKLIIGSLIEDFSAARMVEVYRKYWRPTQVKVILLAESHVFTGASDIARSVTASKVGVSLPDYPTSYVRFVYCLGYGESGLMDAPLMNNPGTTQYWKILYSCVHPISSHADCAPITKGGTPNDSQRWKNKVDLLLLLKNQGVWLVDASITALYGLPKKPSAAKRRQITTLCWDGWVRDVVCDAAPCDVICIGNEVGEVLKTRITKDLGKAPHILPQPQAHLPGDTHLTALQKYHYICSGAAGT